MAPKKNSLPVFGQQAITAAIGEDPKGLGQRNFIRQTQRFPTLLSRQNKVGFKSKAPKMGKKGM